MKYDTRSWKPYQQDLLGYVTEAGFTETDALCSLYSVFEYQFTLETFQSWFCTDIGSDYRIARHPAGRQTLIKLKQSRPSGNLLIALAAVLRNYSQAQAIFARAVKSHPLPTPVWSGVQSIDRSMHAVAYSTYQYNTHA